MTAKSLAIIAVLSAVASLLEIFPFVIPFWLLPFLEFNPSGIPVILAGLIIGVPGAFLTSIVMSLTIAIRGNPLGGFFKFFAEIFTAIPMIMVFWLGQRRKNQNSSEGIKAQSKTRWGIIISALIVGSLGRIIIMTIMNFWSLQSIYGFNLEATFVLLPPIAIFNVVQGLISMIPAIIFISRFPSDLKPEWLSSYF
ncbi:MAG: ECF transporter S component [Candidatus Ranarchaeia archaeon]